MCLRRLQTFMAFIYAVFGDMHYQLNIYLQLMEQLFIYIKWLRRQYIRLRFDLEQLYTLRLCYEKKYALFCNIIWWIVMINLRVAAQNTEKSNSGTLMKVVITLRMERWMELKATIWEFNWSPSTVELHNRKAYTTRLLE